MRWVGRYQTAWPGISVSGWLDTREGQAWLNAHHRPPYTGGAPLTFATVKDDEHDITAAYSPDWGARAIAIYTDPCLRVVEVDECITDLPSPA